MNVLGRELRKLEEDDSIKQAYQDAIDDRLLECQRIAKEGPGVILWVRRPGKTTMFDRARRQEADEKTKGRDGEGQ